MTEQEARTNGDDAAALVVITFTKEITPRDSTFNKGQPFREVTWYNVWKAFNGMSGLRIQFDESGPEYFYPWHSIDRVKIQRFK